MASVQGEKEFTITVGKGTTFLVPAKETQRTGLEGAPGGHRVTPCSRRASAVPRALSADIQTSAYLNFKLLQWRGCHNLPKQSVLVFHCLHG